MRRIYACVLALGIGGMGIGLMRTLAQTGQPIPVAPHEKPIAESTPVPDKRPTTYDLLKNTPSTRRPPSIEKEVAQRPETRAVEVGPLPKSVTPAPEPMLPVPSSLPALDPAAIPAPPKPAPTDPKTEAPGAMPDLVLPTLPPVEQSTPAPEPKHDAPPMHPLEQVKQPMPEPVVAPKPALESASEPTSTPAAPTKTAPPVHGVVPSVSVEAIVPDSVGVGQPLNYEIVVRNVGQVGVHQVRIEDELPRSVRYLGGAPVGEVNGERIGWGLGSIEAGGERRIKVSVKPGSDGEWRTQPQVTFTAAALPVQVRITKPKIAVAVTSPEAAVVGEEVPFQIHVTNSGSGPARSIILHAQLSEGLQHPQGSVIEAELTNVRVGESKTVTLKALAVKTGGQAASLSASADGTGEAAGRVTVQVNPPTMFLKLSGPQRAMVRGEMVFTLDMANAAEAASQPVQAAVAFPDGLEFVSASDGGNFDGGGRIVTWAMGEVAAGGKRSVSVKARASAAGNWAVRAVAKASPRNELKAEATIQVDGVPALAFEVVNLENPVELGKEGTYEIRVVNQGTCACTNVRVLVALSDGLTATALTGPTTHRVEGPLLTFEPIERLAVRADAVFRVRVKGASPGDQRCKVQLSCDQLKQPVVKEESTSFYAAQ